MNGCAARVRLWWAQIIAGEDDRVPPELLKKLRLLESFLPVLGRVVGIKGRTVSDLLPETDEEMGWMLTLVHRWTGRMLDLPSEEPAPSGTLGAGTPTPEEGSTS